MNARRTFWQDDFSSNRHPALTFCLRMSLFAKPVPTFAGHALLLAALLLAGHEARGANPPNVTDDIAPTRVIPAPVDMMPAAPRAPEPEPVETPTGQPSQAATKPSEPSANPLWAIPLSRLTATRDRPLFLPSRRAAAPSVAAVPVTAPTPSAPPPAEPERPSLTLVGAIASETEGFAVFLDQATNTVKSVGPAAERGDARAQARLGFMYQYGRGVPQNYRLAYYWYRRGAEQGNAAAQHLLGLLYDKGQGTPTDHVLAHMWLSLAAAATKGAEHEDNVRLRNAVASKMSLGQLSDAQLLAVSWVPKSER